MLACVILRRSFNLAIEILIVDTDMGIDAEEIKSSFNLAIEILMLIQFGETRGVRGTIVSISRSRFL